MKLIGITGGIGSGKSTIAHELAKRGYAIYDCDHEAKRIIMENSSVRQQIIQLLGPEAFIPSATYPFTGIYNTPYVSQQVFSNPTIRIQLNKIIHPAVKCDIIKKKEASRQEFLFVESAILHESGLDELCDKIVLVNAPEEVRIARTIARDYHGIQSEENINKVRARMKAQKVDKENAIVIVNDGITPISSLVDELISQL